MNIFINTITNNVSKYFSLDTWQNQKSRQELRQKLQISVKNNDNISICKNELEKQYKCIVSKRNEWSSIQVNVKLTKIMFFYSKQTNSACFHYRVAQNKLDYSTFQWSLQKLHKITPFTLVAQRQIRKQKNVHLDYSAVINILCDVIADVVNVNHFHVKNASVNKWR